MPDEGYSWLLAAAYERGYAGAGEVVRAAAALEAASGRPTAPAG